MSKIGIKSVSDLITNSSSETFIIRRPGNLNIEEFKKKFQEITDNRILTDFPWNTNRKNWNTYSGVAGDLDIYTEKECLENGDYIDHPDNKERLRRNLSVNWGVQDNDIPEDLHKFILVNIDHDFLGSIFWALRNFEMIYSELFRPVASKESRKIQDLWMYGDERYEEWKDLEDHPYLPGTKIYEEKMKSILVQKSDCWKILVYQSKNESKLKKIKEEILPKLLPGYSVEIINGEPYGEEYAEDFLLPEIIENELR